MSAKDVSGGGIGQPAGNLLAITPSDAAELEYLVRGIYVGGAGDLTVMTLGGTIGVFVGVTAGSIIPVLAIKVYSTGTSASNLLGMF